MATLPPVPHSPAEDGYAILIGTSFITLGLILLNTAGLVTGGIAGIALLVSYILPVPAGIVLTILNLPFFLLAWRVLGREFTIKTVIANVTISAMALLAPHVITFAHLDPLLAAFFGGTIAGMGVLALARHGAGVGGIGVLAMWLQKRNGWNMGRTQLACDAIILLAAIPVMTDARQWLLSVASAAAIAGVLMANHRPGRYAGY
ncbi:YitT family protein [Sphingomonas montanisoli]|uniref:YitT family protein n=1 Tax=Sphingomonas montanisoli TaxID=2606412 RepID=A0A5D9C6L4_9SPHN|nr:YitT family protein [Sphingomonas montanisoli]TZG27488.1 YitT family protein [Sphingomonas montanisoli]